MGIFCIYGAGIVATSIYMAIKSKYGVRPEAFLVFDREKNPVEIDKIPVIVLSDWNKSDKNMVYLVAVPQPHHGAIRDSLRGSGIDEKQIVWIDSLLENRIMDDFYRNRTHFLTVSQVLEEKECQTQPEENRPTGRGKIEVFQARSQKDRQLHSRIKHADYVKPIQAGAALVSSVFLDLHDDVGDNISAKNGNYCELTAGYYAWKHSSADYKGLCHYRRIFHLSDEQMQRILSGGDTDVILPYPSVHFPNIYSQHVRYVAERDWSAMLVALEERAPDYRKKFERLFCGQYFYNFNMVIAKREVFHDYCSFLFSVLERAEELAEPTGAARSDRFAGYLGENLTTLYFLANRDKLKILHTGKLWLE